jgi:hypothetical protein
VVVSCYCCSHFTINIDIAIVADTDTEPTQTKPMAQRAIVEFNGVQMVHPCDPQYTEVERHHATGVTCWGLEADP